MSGTSAPTLREGSVDPKSAMRVRKKKAKRGMKNLFISAGLLRD
jgi:hypothetical protein